MPRIFEKWIKKTTFSGSSKAYFLLTCGSDMGNAEKYLRKLCKAKQFELTGAKEIVMPENYAAMFEVPDEETSARIRATAERVIRRAGEQISEEKPMKRSKVTLADRFKSAVINPVFYSFCVKSKAFFAKDNCVSCGKCAADCPVNGIIMKDGKPEWTGDCTHCMACLCGCPAGAIEYGKKSVGKVRYQCPEYVPETPQESKGEEKMEAIPMKYTAEYTLAEADFDTQENLNPSTMLSVFQAMADKHGAIMGVDFDTMFSRGLLWVVTQIKYKVCGKLEKGMTVVGESWPLAPSRLGFEREYLLRDEAGNILVKGTSNWAVIDTAERKLASTAGVYPEGEHLTDKNFEEKTRRLRDFEAESEVFTVCPDQSHIDKNNHVNNTKYADFVVASLGGLSGEIDIFQIDYINEVMCGQPLNLSHAVTENATLVKGMSEDGRRMFTCSIKYKG